MTAAPVAITGRGPYFAIVLPTKLSTLALTKNDRVSAEEITPIDHWCAWLSLLIYTLGP